MFAHSNSTAAWTDFAVLIDWLIAWFRCFRLLEVSGTGWGPLSTSRFVLRIFPHSDFAVLRFLQALPPGPLLARSTDDRSQFALVPLKSSKEWPIQRRRQIGKWMVPPLGWRCLVTWTGTYGTGSARFKYCKGSLRSLAFLKPLLTTLRCYYNKIFKQFLRQKYSNLFL